MLADVFLWFPLAVGLSTSNKMLSNWKETLLKRSKTIYLSINRWWLLRWTGWGMWPNFEKLTKITSDIAWEHLSQDVCQKKAAEGSGVATATAEGSKAAPEKRVWRGQEEVERLARLRLPQECREGPESLLLKGIYWHWEPSSLGTWQVVGCPCSSRWSHIHIQYWLDLGEGVVVVKKKNENMKLEG